MSGVDIGKCIFGVGGFSASGIVLSILSTVRDRVLAGVLSGTLYSIMLFILDGNRCYVSATPLDPFLKYNKKREVLMNRVHSCGCFLLAPVGPSASVVDLTADKSLFSVCKTLAVSWHFSSLLTVI